MQNMQNSTFPERLRTILDETGIRQTDLCDKAGIGKSAMSQYLHGAFVPKQAKLHAIAEALDVSDEWLMGYDVPRIRREKGDISHNFEMLAPDDSMKSMHIPKGALVVLRTLAEGETIPQGEIVSITMNGDRPKLRILHADGENIVLTAADPGYAPQMFSMEAVTDGTLQIHGVVEHVEIKF